MTGKFIVIEGLDAVGKSTLACKLANRLGAKLIECPPRLKAAGLSATDLRSHFDKRPAEQRRAFYRAANLVASEIAERALQEKHVVMDRYWPSTVAFSILDGESNGIKKWQGLYPPELREPDAVVLLTVDEENRSKRMKERGETLTNEEQSLNEDPAHRNRILCAYREFNPIEIDTSKSEADEVLEVVVDALRRARLF